MYIIYIYYSVILLKYQLLFYVFRLVPYILKYLIGRFTSICYRTIASWQVKLFVGPRRTLVLG